MVCSCSRGAGEREPRNRCDEVISDARLPDSAARHARGSVSPPNDSALPSPMPPDSLLLLRNSCSPGTRLGASNRVPIEGDARRAVTRGAGLRRAPGRWVRCGGRRRCGASLCASRVLGRGARRREGTHDLCFRSEGSTKRVLGSTSSPTVESPYVWSLLPTDPCLPVSSFVERSSTFDRPLDSDKASRRPRRQPQPDKPPSESGDSSPATGATLHRRPCEPQSSKALIEPAEPVGQSPTPCARSGYRLSRRSPFPSLRCLFASLTCSRSSNDTLADSVGISGPGRSRSPSRSSGGASVGGRRPSSGAGRSVPISSPLALRKSSKPPGALGSEPSNDLERGPEGIKVGAQSSSLARLPSELHGSSAASSLPSSRTRLRFGSPCTSVATIADGARPAAL